MRLRFCLAAAILTLAAGRPSRADDQAGPKPVPPTRAEMKQALESLKQRKPRLPLPPVDAKEKARAGERPLVNNGRMRAFYLPAELRGEISREPDPVMSLDPTFKTMLFWIVSRGNNCHYCLGHQEIKLTSAGLSDDQIAALDCDWARYSEPEQAAFELARKLTHQPHHISAADFDRLRKHYQDVQILEIVFTVANNNATNRWTDALGIPAEENGSAFQRNLGKEKKAYPTFLTPTSARYAELPSVVAPLPGSVLASEAQRPLESRQQVEKMLAACRTRTPRLSLVDEDKARALLPGNGPAAPLPQWVRLLAHFPKAGKGRIISLQTAQEKGALPALLKAQIAWIAARQDRAWYALGLARERLAVQGLSDDAIYALDAWERFTPAEGAAFAFVRKLTATPRLIEDADLAALRKHYRDQAVAELVLHVCNAAFFNRVTEACGLQLETK
jgi:alkylhydroperoxidase family enzyme